MVVPRIAKSTFKPFKDCTKTVLHCGFDDMPDVVLDIVPTMQNITHDGKKFFRLKVTRQIQPDGSQWGVYLWEGWMDENLRRKGRFDLVSEKY